MGINEGRSRRRGRFTKAELAELLTRHKQAEIAKMYNMSESAVSMAVSRYGLSKPPSPTRKKWMPWVIATEHHPERIKRVLQYAVRDEDGKSLLGYEKKLLDEFKAVLDRHRLAVGYHPETGFYTVKREDGEGYVTTRTPGSIDPDRFKTAV